MQPIDKAVQELGCQQNLADAIGVKQSFISQLVSGTRPIPAKLCVKIEKATNGKVTREQLRPDIFTDYAA